MAENPTQEANDLADFFDGCSVSNEQIESSYFAGIIGRPDSGKSFLAGFSPDPFFLATEKGAELVPNVGKIVYTDEQGNQRVKLPANNAQFQAIWKKIVTSKGVIQGRQYKTIVVDGAKFSEQLFCDDVLAKNPTREEKGVTKENISVKDLLFGAGVAQVYTYWERFITGVNKLNDAGINVILICHTAPAKEETPSGEPFKKERIDLLSYGQVSVPNLIMARFDWCYHIRKEAKTRTVKSGFGASKTVAIDGADQDVLVYTRGTSGLDAKCKTKNFEDVPNNYIIDITNDFTSQRIFDDIQKGRLDDK